MVSKENRTYISDPKLVPRIKAFLSNKDPNSTVFPGSVVDHLQATYRDYARKKRNALLQCVSKALPVARREVFGPESKPEAAKKRRHSSSSDSEPENLVAYENTNALNLAMRNLYKMKNAAKESSSPTPKSKDGLKASTSPTPESKAAGDTSSLTPDQQKKSKAKKLKGTPQLVQRSVGSVGWVVDRRGGAHGTNSVQESEDLDQRQDDGLADTVYTPQTYDTPCASNFSFMFTCTCGARKTVSVSDSPKTEGGPRVKVTDDRKAAVAPPVSSGSEKSDKTNSRTLKAVTDADSDKSDRTNSRTLKAVVDADSDNVANSDGNSSLPTKKKKKKRKMTDMGDMDNDLPDMEATVPDNTLKDFGGSEKLLEEIHKDLKEFFFDNLFHSCWRLDKRIRRRYLLHGPRGSGKRFLAECVAGHLKLPLLKPRINTLISGVSGNSEQRIRDLFDQAADQAPCVLYLEDIECLAPRQDTPGVSKDMMTRVASELGSCIDGLKNRPEKVVLIATTSRIESVNKDLRIPGRFKEMALGMPDEKSREVLLQKFCDGYLFSPDVSLKKLAKLTPGFVAGDLISLVDDAVTFPFERVLNLYGLAEGDSLYDAPPQPPAHLAGPNIELTEQDLAAVALTQDDFMEALKKAQPAAKREGFLTVPTTTWEDVGALDDVRAQLQDSILCRVRHPEKTRGYNLSTSSGIILQGPPGCGKTLVAKAMANEAGLNFMYIKGPELLDKYVGESEKRLREVFDKAQTCAPCLIFFDEMDTLCSKRENSEGGKARESVTNQLLALMDGCHERNQVYVMGATNRIEHVDPALQRPGRFNKNIFIGLPDEKGRLEILKALTMSASKCKLVSCDLAHFAHETTGFSGADLKQLVDVASFIAMNENLKGQCPEYVITGQHFSQALQSVKPSVKKKDEEKYLRVAQRM